MIDEGFPGSSAVKNHLPMQEMQVWSLDQDDPLEEEIATHYSILAWEVPWTEEPGRPQSMGSQSVRHNLTTKQQQMIDKLLIFLNDFREVLSYKQRQDVSGNFALVQAQC